MHFNARSLVGGRTGELCRPREAAHVHVRHHAGALGVDAVLLQRTRRLAEAALCFADGVEFLPGGAGVEQRLGPGCAFTCGDLAAHLEQGCGDAQRAVAQVRRRAGLTAQHGEHIAGLQRGPDATPYRLGAVAFLYPDLEAHRGPRVDKLLAQTACHLGVAYLGRGADRDVDQHMRGASGDFLRNHRGHQLTFAVEIQRALHPDHDVVGGAETDRTAPDDAAALAFDDATHVLEGHSHRCQRLHGVGGAGR